jgi:hypothetical protein
MLLARNDLRRGLILLAAVGAAACKGSSYWSDQVQADPLYKLSGNVRTGPACSKLVPMEFGQTIPVPQKDGTFKILFYPTMTSPGKSEVMPPQYAGTFTPDPDRDACAKLPAEAAVSRGPAVRDGVSQTAYYREETKLYASLGKAAALYAKAAPLTDGDKKTLTDFLDAFAVIGEPGLTADYYRANPDFWEWVRKEAGRSIPKA